MSIQGDEAFNRALALYLAGRTSEARDVLLEVIAEFPDHRVCRYSLGVCLNELGEWREAERHLGAVVAAEPTHHLAAYELGAALQEQGRLDEAADRLRGADDTAHRVDDALQNVINGFAVPNFLMNTDFEKVGINAHGLGSNGPFGFSPLNQVLSGYSLLDVTTPASVLVGAGLVGYGLGTTAIKGIEAATGHNVANDLGNLLFQAIHGRADDAAFTLSSDVAPRPVPRDRDGVDQRAPGTPSVPTSGAGRRGSS
jgi:tetratricopeptide (TPR) repeat protein